MKEHNLTFLVYGSNGEQLHYCSSCGRILTKKVRASSCDSSTDLGETTDTNRIRESRGIKELKDILLYLNDALFCLKIESYTKAKHNIELAKISILELIQKYEGVDKG